jgi:hypothetical protein
VRHGPPKLRLPPGLYSVALEREGFRGAKGAVTLVAGDHTTLTGTLTEKPNSTSRGVRGGNRREGAH